MPSCVQPDPFTSTASDVHSALSGTETNICITTLTSSRREVYFLQSLTVKSAPSNRFENTHFARENTTKRSSFRAPVQSNVHATPFRPDPFQLNLDSCSLSSVVTTQGTISSSPSLKA